MNEKVPGQSSPSHNHSRGRGIEVLSDPPSLPSRAPTTSAPAARSNVPSVVLPVLPERKYFKIGEVAELVGVEPHVLRYWETQFPQLRPHKARSGHRLYRRQEVETLLTIQDLLHKQRFTIAGARQALRQRRATTLLPTTPGVSLEVSLAPTPSLLQAAKELDNEPLGDDDDDGDGDGDDDDDELELHLAGPLVRMNEVEIEARDGEELHDALAEQLTEQVARAGRSASTLPRVSRVDVRPETLRPQSQISTSHRHKARALLEEIALDIETTILRLKRL